ncbi:MAG: S8 family serine peptidase [Ignavibacteriae bacterium]|nr:S8 family serine peptidase [Ignavibacteriota bacterium]
MKKHLFVVQTHLVVVLLLVLFSNYQLQAQLKGDLRREILVYIQPNALAFPSLERGHIGIENLPQVSTPLRETFTRFGVQSMAKAFPNFTDVDTIRTREDGVAVKLPQFSRIFKVYVADEADIDSAVSALSKIPGVLYAHKNSDARRNSDPTYSNQWHLKNTGQGGGTIGEDIKAEEAWQIFTGSSSIKIAVVDGGVETGHQDLVGKATGDLPDYEDELAHHGTHVAGIAAAKANNGYGGRGVDWNAQILSEIVFNHDGFMGDGRAAQAITEAVNDGAHIINHSWGGPTTPTLDVAMAYAYKMNRVTVAAMGNFEGNSIQWPAAFVQGVIAVGATQDNGIRDPGSKTGNHIDVVAPGGFQNFDINGNAINNAHDIWSTLLNNSYGYVAGTSMAAPVVSGIASLLKGYNPNLYNDDIENIIKLSVDDKGPTGWDPEYGYGRVNAKKALERLGANNSGYVVNHATSSGGTDQGASSNYLMTIYGAQGLSDGVYNVIRHEVRKNVTFAAINSPVV